MSTFPRIRFDPHGMGGKLTVERTRVTVGTIVGLIASEHAIEEVLGAYRYLQREEVLTALAYAAEREE